MALQKTTVTVHGFEAVDAYHRVENIFFVNKTQINFNVRSYKEVNMPFFTEQIFSCKYDVAGENPIKQAYIHLKTLPEFVNAANC